MILKCVSNTLDQDLRDLLNPPDWFKGTFTVTAGKEYVALGLVIGREGCFGNSSCEVYIRDDHDKCCFLPLCLFNISDGTLSRHWTTKRTGPDEVRIWPPSFFRQYYHDDLSEDVPEIVADFEAVYQSLYDEAMGARQKHN
jgi:hypothetical protein